MRFRDPEVLYRRFIAHIAGCGICRDAGGEAAELAYLCEPGRLLAHLWDQAERTHAEREVRP